MGDEFSLILVLCYILKYVNYAEKISVDPHVSFL